MKSKASFFILFRYFLVLSHGPLPGKDSSCLGRFQALTNSLPELDQDRSSATLDSIYVLFEIAIKSLASSRSVLKFLGQSVG